MRTRLLRLALVAGLTALGACAGPAPRTDSAPPATAGPQTALNGPGQSAPLPRRVSDAELAAALAPGSGIRVWDVRTPAEFAEGHIPGAENHPLQTLQASLAGLDPSTPVILYCRSGNRSGQAWDLMVREGFSSVSDYGAVGRWSGPLARGR